MQKFLSLCFGWAGAAGAARRKSRTQSRLVLRGLLSALTLGWLATSLHAQLILDPFNYGPGLTLAGQSPFAPLTWVAAGPAGAQQARIQAGALPWPGLSNSAPNRVIIRAGNGPSSLFVFGTPDTTDAYPPITTDTIYFSFVLRVTDLTGLAAGGSYFAGFAPDQTGGAVTPANVFTRVLLRPSGAGYNLGLVKSAAVAADFTWDTTVFAVGDTVLLVGAYTFSTGENVDVAQLWINPDPTTFCSTLPPAPTLVNNAGPDATQLASVAYLQRPTPAQPTALLTDELRVAKFWDGVVRPGWDYPDAPGSYHTLYADNAARHTVVPGTYMGTQIDVECDGQPTAPADGDDSNNLDDGDGVTWSPGPWLIDSTRNITVTVSVDGKLDAFFDWNKNNTFDLGEKVFASVDVFAAAPNTLTVTVPAGATAGFTYARFRFSTAGGLGPVGPAPNGEVEDYRIQVQAPPPPPPDLGVAVLLPPQPVTDTSNFTYSITVTNKGGGDATATMLSIPLPTGITFTSATTSQGSCSNSPSGVQCSLGTVPANGRAAVNVVGIPDFNQLATLHNIPEMQEVVEVTNTVTVTSAETDALPADNVAVVAVGIVPLRDFTDAPYSATYHTLNTHDGARHRIVGPYFGNSPAGHVHRDADPDGMPSINADGDNVSDGNNDERGIRLLDPVFPGATSVRIEINAPLGGRVDGFIDWNHNRSWDDLGDQVFVSLLVPAGVSVHTISVPPGALPGDTYARFRISENGGLSDHGYANNGEVEDYKLTITFPPIVAFNGLQHEALGGAQLNVVSNLLSVTTTGATGGLKVTLGESDGYAAYFQGLDHLEAANASVQFSAYGHLAGNTNNQLLSSLRIDGQGSNATVSVDFSGLGATQYHLIFYNGHAGMAAVRSLPQGTFVPVFPCPSGSIRVLTVRFINGRWMLHYECVRIPGAGPEFPDLSDIRVVELVPDVDQYEYRTREVHFLVSGLSGTVSLNDAVYNGSGLYTAAGDAMLQVSPSGVSAMPAGSNSSGGLVLHSGVSDLSGGQLAALFDENIFTAASLRVNPPQPPQIINSILLRAKLRIQPYGTTEANDLLAELTALGPEETRITTDFSALNADQVLVEIYHGSNHVGSVTVPSGNIGTISGSNVVTEVSANSSGPYRGFAFSFAGPVTFTATGGGSFIGDNYAVIAQTSTNLPHIGKGLSVVVLGRVVNSLFWQLSLDRGDAPAARSLLDARHLSGTGMHLGSLWDAEPEGYFTDDCTGDDRYYGSDDEDGVASYDLNWPRGGSAELRVSLHGTATYFYVGIWVDWDNSSTFDPDEFMAGGLQVGDGNRTFTFDVPPLHDDSARYVHMRVRVANAELAPEDACRISLEGECEDYQVTIDDDAQSIAYAGLLHTALGGAALNLSSNGLQISNLGSSGQDGLRMNLAGREGNVRASFASLALDNVGSQVQFNLVAGLHAGLHSDAGVISLARTGNGILLFGDMAGIGSTGFLLEIWNNGVRVSSTTVASSNVTGTITSVNLASLPGLQQLAVITDRPDGAILYAAQFTGLSHFSFPGLEADGDELHLVALNPTRRIDNLARLEIRGANIAGFTVGGVTMARPSLSLQMANRNGRPAIQWSQADALLEQADSVAGPWNIASSATTGVTVDPTNSQKYFRLVQMAARSELAKMLRRAELVFEGTVTAVEYHDSTPQSTNDPAVPHTFVTFAVNRVLRGSYTAGTITLRFAGGLGANGRLLRVKDSTLFDVGERSILLAHGNEQYASPLVKWAGGRFRLVDGEVYTENGHELVATQNGKLQIGSWRDLTEVRENSIAGYSLKITHSTDVNEEGQTVTPPEVEKMTEEAFRQFLLELIQRIHTTEELQSLTPVSSANAAQPFSVPNPAPRRVR